jgi:hypothetical protein
LGSAFEVLKLRKIFWILAILAAVGTMWALNVEITFERNLHRGIPADFRMRSEHRPVSWKI